MAEQESTTADEFDALSLTLCKAKGLTDLLNEAVNSEATEQLYDQTLSTVLDILLHHIEDAEKLTQKLNQRLRPKPPGLDEVIQQATGNAGQ